MWSGGHERAGRVRARPGVVVRRHAGRDSLAGHLGALLDEACGLTGNALLVGEGPPDDTRVTFVGLYYRGQRRLDLEREYLEVYHPINEGIPRLRQLPDGHLVPIKDLYTAEELKTSRAYNEAYRRGQYQQGVNVRLAGGGGAPP